MAAGQSGPIECVYQMGTKKKTNHTFFKNWSGPSASEADIILKDFQAAEKQHGVRYTIFIGDGDSSVHFTLVANVKV